LFLLNQTSNGTRKSAVFGSHKTVACAVAVQEGMSKE